MTFKLYREEIALAMELRTEGCQWKLIALGLGVTEATLISSVNKAKDYGRDPRPPVYRPWLGREEVEVTGFKCACPSGVIAGDYSNQVTVPAPDHMPKENGYSLDRCVADEVVALWSLGITTTGCCCGHRGKYPAFIGVVFSEIPRMKALGYSVVENEMRPGDEDSFAPMGADHVDAAADTAGEGAR